MSVAAKPHYSSCLFMLSFAFAQHSSEVTQMYFYPLSPPLLVDHNVDDLPIYAYSGLTLCKSQATKRQQNV